MRRERFPSKLVRHNRKNAFNKDDALMLLMLGFTILIIAGLTIAVSAASVEALKPEPPSFGVSLVHNTGMMAKNLALAAMLIAVFGLLIWPSAP